MTHDLFGQDSSLTQRKALEDWNAVQLGVLAHGADTAVHLGAVLDAEPEFALAHAIKGLSLLMLGRRELLPVAQEALAVAKTCYEGALPRERKYIDALDSWMGGRPSEAIARMEEVLTTCPTDALAMKLSHGIRFILGDSKGMRASLERVMPPMAPITPRMDTCWAAMLLRSRNRRL